MHPGRDTPVTVLLVEDEFLIRLDIADMINEFGWAVIEAASADEAVAVIHSGTPFDILLTDVLLPGSVDGIFLAKFVRERLPNSLVVVMSGHHVPGDEDPCFDLFLKKPFGELIATLEDAWICMPGSRNPRADAHAAKSDVREQIVAAV